VVRKRPPCLLTPGIPAFPVVIAARFSLNISGSISIYPIPFIHHSLCEVKPMSRKTIPCTTSRTLTAAACLAALALLAGGCSKQESSAPESMQTMQAPPEVSADVEAIIEEPAVEVVEAPAETAEPAMEAGTDEPAIASGEEIYTNTCANCHAAGIAGAPKLGDKEAWAPRIAKGNDALFESVKNGLNVMPPKGTCMSCSDEELRSAMEYMVSQGS